MSESRTAKAMERVIRARYGASFWDGVECEIEALDAADFELFLAAGSLDIEPRPEFREALLAHLGKAVRARFSN
jgi:hypothetical protein